LVFGILTVALILAFWQFALDVLVLIPFFAKRPGDVWEFLVTHSAAPANRATLLGALAETFAYTIPGYLAGIALGALLACLFTLAPGVAAATLPAAIAIRSIPILTTAPLIVLALGRGPAGIVAIVAVMIFFPTLVACLHGLRQAPGQILDVFASYGAGRWRHLTLAQIPAALPAFFAAARMSVPSAILAVTVAEWLATGTGIGNLMSLTHSTSNYNMLWSAVTALTVITFAVYAAVGRAERAVLRIYAPEQTSA
jgi:sulfonate transport system permease protein